MNNLTIQDAFEPYYAGRNEQRLLKRRPLVRPRGVYTEAASSDTNAKGDHAESDRPSSPAH